MDISNMDFTEDVKESFMSFLNDHYHCEKITQDGSDIIIQLETRASSRHTLTLINATGAPEGEFAYYDFYEDSLIGHQGEYSLKGEAQDYGEDAPTPFTIHFTDAKSQVVLFRADTPFYRFFGTPWLCLMSIADRIMNRYYLPGDCLNDREKELLPLMAELYKWKYYEDSVPEELKVSGFPQLKSYITKYNFTELLPLLEKLENAVDNDEKRYRLANKFASKLDFCKYEPLWRELYDLIVKSQEEYPTEVSLYCSPKVVENTRTQIQTLMESHGYTGTYPDFVKNGSIGGLRLAESFNIPYFLWKEKNVVHHIHCNEHCVGELLTIEFLCGTRLLRKGNTTGDISSCMFNANGYRFFQAISYESHYINDDGEIASDHLEKYVQIAVKNAELEKLSKEETKEVTGFTIPYFKTFFISFIVMGGLFSIIYFLVLILLSALIFLVVGQPQEILSLVATMWWKPFVLAWILFGGALFGLAIFSMKRI